jgi:hypothetical protein
MKMTTRLLMTTTAALLAGTVFAAAQSVQSGGDRERTGPNHGQTTQRPAGKESAGQEQVAPNRKAQASPQDRQRGREQPTTSGQGSRDQDGKSLDNKNEGGKSQTLRQPDNDRQQGHAKQPSRTEGQAPRDQGQIQRDQDRQQGQNQREPERNQKGAREGERGGANVTVNLTSEQRTKIRDTVFKEKDAPRVGKVDFSLNEGTVIPRSVKIVEIPQVIVAIHPEWQRYKYFIVNEELVIVEPETLRIVAIMDV